MKRRYLGTFVLAGLVITLGLAGCTKPVLRDKPPPDPLLTSKKPIEGKPASTDTRPAPDEDLSPPPRPVVEDDVLPVRLLGLQPVPGPR